jgi:hypothetical protein
VDLSILPTFFALAFFVCCFRPLVRRAGPHTNVWFYGWVFLLIHYLRFLVLNQSVVMGSVWNFMSTSSIEACSLCFMWAASNARPSRFNRIFALEIAIPVLLQSGMYFFYPHHRWLQAAVLLLLVVPGIHLLIQSKYQTKAFNSLAIAFALLGIVLAFFRRVDSFLIVGILLGAVLLSAAYLVFACAAKATRGTNLMIAGLSLWALTSPLETLGLFDSNKLAYRAILDLPRYLLAGGMVLSCLGEYINRT